MFRSRTALKWAAWAVLAVDAAIFTAAAVNFADLRMVNNAIDIWFDRSDPTLQTLKLERSLFGTETWMLATVWTRTGEGSEDAAAVSRRLTRKIEQIDHVSRVISPTSIPVLQRSEQGLFFDRLDSDQQWKDVRSRLLDHPFAGHFLVHEKSSGMFSLLIRERTSLSSAGSERRQMVAELRRTLDTDPAITSSALSGTAVINADLNRLSMGDFVILLPATFVVASIALLILIRFRVRTTLAILTPVGIASVAIVVAMLVSGKPLTMMTIGLPGLIFVLGIASSLHVTGWIANWLEENRGSIAEAAGSASRSLIRPMLVSQITTALGFAVLAVIQVGPVQEMALFGAAGVILSALHVLFMLPQLLLWTGGMKELDDNRPLFAGATWAGPRLDSLVESMRHTARARYWMAGVATVCVATVWFIGQVKFDSTYLAMIDESERLRQDYARFDAAGMPSAELSVLIRRSGGSDLMDARLNTQLREATREIEALPGVSKVLGPAAVFNEVAPALAGNEPLARFVADDASVTDAYIFALSGNTDTTSYVHDGLDAWRMVVFFPYVENSRLEHLSGQISSILDKHLGSVEGVSAQVSGVTALWANMDNAISQGQITSILFMAATCFVSFLLSVRDWRLAATSTFVNVLPVAMVGALLGATGQPIDMATVFIMGIALGIADDDTSFFVHECLRRERHDQGALTSTLRHTGPTTVAACLVVTLGFSILCFSSFVPIRTFGLMTALGIFLAMSCDVFLLPFLLVVTGRRNQIVREVDSGAAFAEVARAGAD